MVCLLAPPSWLAGAGSNGGPMRGTGAVHASAPQVETTGGAPSSVVAVSFPGGGPMGRARTQIDEQIDWATLPAPMPARQRRPDGNRDASPTAARHGSHHDGSHPNAERGEIAPPCAGHCDFLTKRCRDPNPSTWVRRVGSGLSDVELSPSVGPVAVSRRHSTCRCRSSDPAHRWHHSNGSAPAHARGRRAPMWPHRTVATGISHPSVPP